MSRNPLAAKRGAPPEYELVFYETAGGDEPVRRWIKEELSPIKRWAIGTAMNRILAKEGISVCETEWGKALGDSLYEFRLRDEVETKAGSEKILLRVFFHPYGNKLILLLGGYDKGESPSARRQNKEITEARNRKRLEEFRDRQRRAARAPRR